MRLEVVLVTALLGCGSARLAASVPRGSYFVGCDRSDFCADNPRRTVTTDAYSIDRSEATYREYSSCSNAGACPILLPKERQVGDPRDIAVLSLSEASEYRRWRGGRLPTNEEW